MKINNTLRKEELIILNKNLKAENIELRKRINSLISQQERKQYMKNYKTKTRKLKNESLERQRRE